MSATSCPKDMVHGPCGGVRADGSCEVLDDPCVFLDQPVITFEPTRLAACQVSPAPAADPTARSAGDEMRQRLAVGRVVVADLPAAALDAESIQDCAAVLRGRVHAVLAGDAPSSRVQFPPAYRASLVQRAGLAPWAGINCRDRNRVAIEGELAALAHAGVAGVHCVTGDHPASGSRPDAAAVFDLDSTEVAALARAVGVLASVAEAPASPPQGQRPDRLVEKLRAGAEVCFVNHCGGVEAVEAFVGAVQSRGVDPWFIACVPVVVDHSSAELLASLPSLVLPAGFLDQILESNDPYAQGVETAVALAESLLQVPGIAGVNLSGGTGPGQELRLARGLAEIGGRLGVAS